MGISVCHLPFSTSKLFDVFISWHTGLGPVAKGRCDAVHLSWPDTCCAIQGLAKLIGDHAPAAVKAQKFENYFGRKLAIDASMCIYQFLVRTINSVVSMVFHSRQLYDHVPAVNTVDSTV
jgi:XPG N-terminal domain